VIDVGRLNDKLEAAKAAKIPVIGFDSGIPNAPEGTVVSTASTNNYAAGELAAEMMFGEASVNTRVSNATASLPVVIGVLSQDATSVSIVERTRGFADKLRELVEGIHPGAVAVTGHDSFAQPAHGAPAVEIRVLIPATTGYTDAQISAQNLLISAQNLIGIFCSNEGAVTGLLAATNEGVDLDRETGVYKDITVVGFDAGISQKQAVRNQYFYGAITQDPYQIGYLAVELAYKAIKGEKVEAVVDTGCKFYNHENIDDPEIGQLVYD
jgi:ribose transport system substrate-binding protein